MGRLKSILAFVFSITLIILPMAGTLAAQSGRTRPRVTTPGTSAPPVEPVNIPAAAVVVKQEQVGSASRFAVPHCFAVRLCPASSGE